MLKILLLIFALLVLSLPVFGDPASKPSEAQAQASVLPNEIQVTLNQPDKAEPSFFDSKGFIALIGVLGVIAGGLVSLITRSSDNTAAEKRLQKEFEQREKESAIEYERRKEETRIEYERKQAENLKKKQLDVLAFIYRKIDTTCESIFLIASYYKDALQGDIEAQENIKKLDLDIPHCDIRIISEYIELNLEEFVNDLEEIWEATRVAHSLSFKVKTNFENTTQMQETQNAYGNIAVIFQKLLISIAAKSRELQAVDQPSESEPSTESKTSSNSPSGSTT